MKLLFTIHAGEFVVGDHIAKTFKRVNLWVPSQDMGVDLLVTDSTNQKAVSLQVKFSRDFLATHMPAIFQKPLRACGWWSLNRQKIATSRADYWVFVLVGFERRSTDFVVIKPSELLARLEAIHGKAKTIQSYLWVTEKERCWETRGLKRQEQVVIAQGQYSNGVRDFSEYLNDWTPVKTLNMR
ncbi:MAG: hypothetical protein ABSF48_01130 [Thermodesulfobacteriota bacterium]|jgi:hypothetical protein